MKVCSNKNCIHGDEPQELSSFCKNKNHKDGLGNYCRECRSTHRKLRFNERYEYNKVYQKLHPDQVRKNKLKSRYGITVEFFNNMLISQKNKCGGCGIGFTNDINRKPVIHHDHKTGEIIGLWHGDCNIAEGNMRNSDVAFSIARATRRRELESSLFKRK